MDRKLLVKILENKNLKDIPTIYIVKILIAILEEEYDYEN